MLVVGDGAVSSAVAGALPQRDGLHSEPLPAVITSIIAIGGHCAGGQSPPMGDLSDATARRLSRSVPWAVITSETARSCAPPDSPPLPGLACPGGSVIAEP